MAGTRHHRTAGSEQFSSNKILGAVYPGDVLSMRIQSHRRVDAVAPECPTPLP